MANFDEPDADDCQHSHSMPSDDRRDLGARVPSGDEHSGNQQQASAASDSDTLDVTELIEAERAQIGHEIHDALIPLIFAAAASVSTIKEDASLSPSCRQRLTQVDDWLDLALTTARRILNHAYPPELQTQPWSQAARDAINRLYPDAAFEVTWDLDTATSNLHGAEGLAAYRITVEAVRNAVNHGKATTIHVEGRCDDQTATISIRDNGSGFNPDQVPSDRYGIRSIRGRAALIGGKARIESQPGGPTIVTVTIPRTR